MARSRIFFRGEDDPKEDSFYAGGEPGLGGGCAGVQVPSDRGGARPSLPRARARVPTRARGQFHERNAADGKHVGAPGPETRGRAYDSKGQLGVCLIASHGPGDGEHARPVAPGQPIVEEAEGAGQGDFSSARHSLLSAAGGVGQSSEFAAAEIPGHAERNSGGLIKREGDQTSWNYLAWVKDTTIPPMTHDRLICRIEDLRFHGVRPLTEDLQGEIYTMVLEVGTNGEREQNVHAFLRDLCNLSVWPGAVAADSPGQPHFGEPTVSSQGDASDILQQGVPQFVCFRRFTLFNPDNRCYQNAIFLAIAWAHARAGEALSSSYRQTFFQCARSGGMALRQSGFWMQLTSRWPNPHLQHDAAEFLAHILQQAPVPAFSGSWASYSAGQMRDYHDLGHSPLLLRIGRRRSLQSMIQGWHADPESRNSLLQAPRLLIVQIMRFSFTGGSVRKSQISFRLPQLLRFPCQTHADAPVEWLSYSVTCGTLHLGGTPQTGHYRSFFILEREVRDSSRYWLTEDSQTLQAADEEAMQLVQRNCYLLFCQRQGV